jgi:RimJ/RimL family protein N-acetyltransferase
MGLDFDPQTVALRDGTAVVIRAVQATDAPRVLALHRRLSRRTLFMRFLCQSMRFDETDARLLCEAADPARLTLVAAPLDDPDTLIGIAFAAPPSPAEPDTAEAAIVVEDAFQGRGLGWEMLRRLVAAAYLRGVRTLTACVHCRNEQVNHFIRRSHARVERTISGGVCELRIHLDREVVERETGFSLDPSAESTAR